MIHKSSMFGRWLAITALVPLTVLAGSPGAPAGAAPLTADQLLLVYNRDDPRSRELAEYYARVRSVPPGRLFGVRAKLGEEEIEREQFDTYIASPIREYLESDEADPQIRCLVLFYGLPIRVGPKRAVPAEQQLARKWQQEIGTAMGRLEQVVAGLERASTKPAGAPVSTKPADAAALPALVQRYQQAVAAEAQRLQAAGPQAEGGSEPQKLVVAIHTVQGAVHLLSNSNPQAMAPELAVQFQQEVRKAQETEEQINRLRSGRLSDPAREEARQLIARNYGLLGWIQSLQYDITLTRTEETTASLDSELAVVRYGEHILHRWVPNALSWRVRSDPASLSLLTSQQRVTPVLMTCRIDGPSMEVARRIIDDSIAAEQKGLDGTVYIDARGLKSTEGHGEYDENLRELAHLLWRETDLLVRLDNRPALFAAGECTDAMLYCGWYSVRQFVDSFSFVPGAVGYHIASFEAISLKAPIERGWVKGLLNDGVAATLGPVAEPYLHSFPRPKEFFGLLLTGRFSLAECYAYTADLHSWMMLLIGDPLYRPFASKPRLRLDQVLSREQVPPEFWEEPASRPAGQSQSGAAATRSAG